jgi:hypothetical protein
MRGADPPRKICCGFCSSSASMNRACSCRSMVTSRADARA